MHNAWVMSNIVGCISSWCICMHASGMLRNSCHGIVVCMNDVCYMYILYIYTRFVYFLVEYEVKLFSRAEKWPGGGAFGPDYSCVATRK